jgi:hypothetical protein
MSDPQAVAIIASNLFGKTIEYTQGGFTIVKDIRTVDDALAEAVRLLHAVAPTMHR